MTLLLLLFFVDWSLGFTLCHCFGFTSSGARFDAEFNVTSCAACAVDGTASALGCSNFTMANATIDPLPQCQDSDALQPWTGEFQVQSDLVCNQSACCCPVAPLTFAQFDASARSFRLSGAMVGRLRRQRLRDRQRHGDR
jgi:hypothetical protein